MAARSSGRCFHATRSPGCRRFGLRLPDLDGNTPPPPPRNPGSPPAASSSLSSRSATALQDSVVRDRSPVPSLRRLRRRRLRRRRAEALASSPFAGGSSLLPLPVSAPHVSCPLLLQPPCAASDNHMLQICPPLDMAPSPYHQTFSAPEPPPAAVDLASAGSGSLSRTAFRHLYGRCRCLQCRSGSGAVGSGSDTNISNADSDISSMDPASFSPDLVDAYPTSYTPDLVDVVASRQIQPLLCPGSWPPLVLRIRSLHIRLTEFNPLDLIRFDLPPSWPGDLLPLRFQRDNTASTHHRTEMDSKVMISGDGGAPPPEPMSIRRMVIPAIFSLGIYFSSLQIDVLAEHPLFVPLLFFLWAEVAITLGLVSFAVAGPRVHCEDQLAVKRPAEEIAMRIANVLLFFVFALWIAVVVSIIFSAL